MKIWDELKGKYVEFNNMNETLRIYVCGPTVYDTPHLGHLKTYIVYDSIVKYLRHRGFSVFYIQNITDIDDKIINRALETGEDPMVLSRKFTKEYMDVMKSVGIDSVSFYARATLSINDIIRGIRSLEKKGFTYRLPDGIYFRVWMDKEYGALSHQISEKQVAGKRAQVSDLKEDPRDFVLWKFQKEGEPSWNSPWGPGRPGWHIEDTSIIMRYLGRSFHIHGAGADLKFPHNESEFSLIRSVKGNSNACRAWTYSGIIKINGEKMSKSLNNGISARELLEKYSTEEIRYAFLSVNYRSELDFTWKMLDDSREAVSYLKRAEASLRNMEPGKQRIHVEQYKKTFYNYLEEDFNSRMALITLNELASEIFKSSNLSQEDIDNAANLFSAARDVFGILPEDEDSSLSSATVEKLLDLRKDLRERKMYEQSDAIRDALFQSHVVIEDKGGKVVWHRR